MNNKYLWLTIVGIILPNIFVIKETLATGNILLWTDPVATLQGMFANNICSAFAVDLLFIVILFLFWSYRQAQIHKIDNWWISWMVTFLLGIAGGLPLFLYLREGSKE